jgi:hypothetical protein
MGLKFHQGKVSLKLFQEKTSPIILGEILHYVWEFILCYERELFSLNPDSEEFSQKALSYVQKALAYYPEPLPQRHEVKEKTLKLLKEAFKSPDIKIIKQLISQNFSEFYREADGFLQDLDPPYLRPDFIIKASKNWTVLEFKLHKTQEEEKQLEKYFEFLKKLAPNDNIRVYLVTFEPFSIELRYAFSPSNPSQLSLFENIN